MQVVGAGLVIISCGAMGLTIAASYRQRVENLRHLATFVQCLESEISYAHTTLPEVIAWQRSQHTGVVQHFLAVLEQGMATGVGAGFAEIWERGLRVLTENGLPAWLVDDLRHLGAALGQSDVEEQRKHLALVQKRLEQALEEAKGEQGGQTKLWSYLGFFSGLLLVLLLF